MTSINKVDLTRVVMWSACWRKRFMAGELVWSLTSRLSPCATAYAVASTLTFYRFPFHIKRKMMVCAANGDCGDGHTSDTDGASLRANTTQRVRRL